MRLPSDAANPKRSREREWRQGDTGYRTIQLRISHSAAPPRHVRQSPGSDFIAYQTAQRLLGSKLFVRIVAPWGSALLRVLMRLAYASASIMNLSRAPDTGDPKAGRATPTGRAAQWEAVWRV
jgi:hypothetical protein